MVRIGFTQTGTTGTSSLSRTPTNASSDPVTRIAARWALAGGVDGLFDEPGHGARA